MSAQLAGAGTTPAPNKPSASQSARQNWQDWNVLKDSAFILALLSLVAALFWKTVFFAVPVSKIARLATWDSAFAQYSNGSSAIMDPSVIQLMVPYYMLVAKLWHAGQIPLWNPYSACGVPLLADPQSFALSPLHLLLAIWPCMRCYNLILLAELAIGAVGTFVLARSLSLGRLGAMLAALAFAFCPFHDWFLEQLGSGYMLFPFVFWLFVRSALRPTILRGAAAGVGASVLVLSGHPEPVFFGTAFGALFAFCLICLDAAATNQPVSQRVLVALRQVAAAAAVAACLSAPMLVPFAEYLKNADCYKFGAQAAGQIPLQLLLLNLMQPALGGGSLYLGILPVLSLPFCFAPPQSRELKVLGALAIVGLVGEAFSSLMWPVGAILKHTPLAALVPNYCQPIPMLMLALMGAFGFCRLTGSHLWTSKRTTTILITTALVLLLVPLALIVLQVPLSSLVFDAALTNVGLNLRDWRLAAVLTVAIVLLLATRRFWRPHYVSVPVALAIALSFLGQFSISRHAVPTTAKFDYGATPATEQLSKTRGRFIALGDHLLKPNTNSVYGLSDLRIHNPLFPSGYRALVIACGGQLDEFNETFTAPLRPSLSIASVAQVASLGPVWTAGATDRLSLRTPASACRWTDDIQIDRFSSGYDAVNSQVVGKLLWHLRAPKNLKELAYSLVLIDSNGATVWFGDSQPLVNEPPIARPVRRQTDSVSSSQVVERDFAVAIPLSVKRGAQPLTVGVQLFDWKTMRFQKPTAGKILQEHICDLCSFTTAGDAHLQLVSDPTFRLVKEIAPSLRFYENKLSLPQAYAVRSVHKVDSKEEAIAAIAQPDFAFQTEAVFESNDSDIASGTRLTDQSLEGVMAEQTAAVEPVPSVIRKSPVEVDIATKYGSERALVLTDSYYPGWDATIDGKPVAIYRANGFFRGILLPPGEHQVVFKYNPRSFQVGLVLAGAMAALLVALATASALASGRAGKRSEDERASA